MGVNTKFNIVLVEPEIPQNTGNIIRLSACCGADLYLVGRLGFSLEDKYLKRAGLDYFDGVNVRKVPSMEDLTSEFPDANFYYLTTKTTNLYTNVRFKPGDFLVFGPETRGLDADLLEKNAKSAITIPMQKGKRSLNLSNSVAIVVYEAIRQNG